MSTHDTNQNRVEDTHESAREDTVERLREQLEAAVRDLGEYRTLVRDRAITGFKDHNWSLEQLNESLGQLDLEPFEPTYVHTTRATLELSLTVDESEYDHAYAALRQLDTAAARDAILEAIIGALSQNTTSACVPDQHLTVSFAPLNKRMVD